MKLFESIMKHFDNDSLGLLGAVIGEHEVKVRDGVETAAAEILCAIGSQTKSTEGRGMLWRELRDTDQSVATSFPNQLHYRNSLALVESGKQQLSGLIGQEIDDVTRRVSHAADVGSSSASKMVGAVSPLIFSSLAAWQKKENVDAEGWQKLFADQSEGSRERAIRSATRRTDSNTGQRTFPSFDKAITAGQGDGKWTAGSGFTPGYTGSADEKFHASGLTSASPNAQAPQTGKVANGIAGAAALAGAASTGAKVTGAAGAGEDDSYERRHELRKNRPAFATNPAESSFASNRKVPIDDNIERPRWVPDKENLKRERERAAIERARSEREARLAKENSGGLGWLWWQLALLAGLAGLGWFYRAEISDVLNEPTAIAKEGASLSEEPAAMLPSEESADTAGNLASQTDEVLDTVFTEPHEGASTDETSTRNEVVEGSLESTSGENDTPPLSSPSSEADPASPNSQQGDDAPMLTPTEGAGSSDQGSAPVVADPTAETNDDEDVDFKVEEALTSLELAVKKIKDEATAKSALPKMEESVVALEDLLKTSSDWEYVYKELIDMQLEEAAGLFGKLKKSVTGMPNVKRVVTPTFERLEKLLVPQQATAP
jgi:hypothetical protein